MHVYSTKLKQH